MAVNCNWQTVADDFIDKKVFETLQNVAALGDQTNTYYAIVLIYRTSKNSPTLQYVKNNLSITDQNLAVVQRRSECLCI